jgi:hypothetical protein
LIFCWHATKLPAGSAAHFVHVGSAAQSPTLGFAFVVPLAQTFVLP